MNVWGAVPVLAVALMGPAAGAHLAASQRGPEHISTVSDVISRVTAPTALAPVQTTPSPVLQQLAGGEWQVTVVMSGTVGASCPSGTAAASSFSLETVSPAVTENATGVEPSTSSALYPCELTVTFGPLSQVPASATLLYSAASPIQLTVSRRVTSFDYIWRPAIFGAAAAVALALVS